mmetsp:Transcript_99650/g.237564  ORF Transcript_99650/g.237564 Transcript_99650/m.237564 type:complete len:219 (-) Transcript_99650:405-1061(-)
MHAALKAGGPQLGVVDQQLRDVIHRLLRSAGPEDLVPWVRLDLRELELGVVRVHGHQLLPRRGSQDLDDLHQLIHAALAREHGMAQDELGRDASGRPNVDDEPVVSGAKDQLRSTVVSRTNVGHIRLPLDQWLGRPKVTKLQRMRVPVHQKVLRLNVTVADPNRVDVRTGPAHLVGVELHEDVGHRLLHLAVVLHDAVYRVGAKFHDNIQIGLARLLP